MNKYQIKFKSSAAKEFMEVIKLGKKGQVSIYQTILKRLEHRFSNAKIPG